MGGVSLLKTKKRLFEIESQPFTFRTCIKNGPSDGPHFQPPPKVEALAKVSITIRLDKKDLNGHAPLCLILRHKGDRVRHTLPVRIHPRYWNKKGEVRKTLKGYGKINVFLAETLEKAKSAMQNEEFAGAVDLRRVRAAIRNRESGDACFIQYARERLSELEKRGQYATFGAYKTAVNKFEVYVHGVLGRKRLPFPRIDLDLLRGFQTELVSVHKNKVNTVHKNMTAIQAILVEAIKEGLFPQEKNPFYHIKLRKERSAKPSLSLEEFKSLEIADLPAGLISEVRDRFIFAVYAGGMRISDIFLIRVEDIKQIRGEWRFAYMQRKTNKPVFMTLLPRAEKILRKTGWPDRDPKERIFNVIPSSVEDNSQEMFRLISSKTALSNKYLVKITNRLGLPVRLSTHIARHTFSNIIDEKGVSVRKTSALLGHSNITTTENYLKMLRGGVADDELRMIFE